MVFLVVEPSTGDLAHSRSPTRGRSPSRLKPCTDFDTGPSRSCSPPGGGGVRVFTFTRRPQPSRPGPSRSRGPGRQPGPGRRPRAGEQPGPGRRPRAGGSRDPQPAAEGSAAGDGELGPPGRGAPPRRSSSQPSGSTTRRGEPCRPARRPTATGNGSVGVEAGEQASRPGQAVDQGQLGGGASPPAGKPLRYQATCLRKSLQPALLAQVLGQQLGVAAHHRGDLAERRAGVGAGAPGERRGQVARTATAGPGSRGRRRRRRSRSRAIIAQRVGGLPDVAVAEHRDRRRAASSRAIASQSAVPE